MRHTILRPVLLALPVLLLGALLLTAPVRAEPEAEKADKPFTRVVKGEKDLPTSFSDALELKLGDRLEATTKLHITDWFGSKAISGQVDVKNPTEEEIHFSYHLAFFDKDGVLLGAANQTMSMDPGEETIVGGALIQLPKKALEAVKRYQIVWYEDDKEIGKR